MNPTAIEISSVTKHYGSGEHAVRALHDISFSIAHNEFFTLLGPSGCGKTTLLRTIGGFEEFSEGEIKLYGQVINGLPANQRPVNTVFQHYALFPHMTILENVGFGLRMLGKPADEARRRSQEMLELVKLADFAGRKPGQLSGGQQQRVALARALAPAPKVLLLDEPLSALDLKLRQSMRYELRQIRETLGITFIFVTHDQEEALTMSDRIAVMSHGEIQQIGDPEEIYREPRNVFVADFIGETNLAPVTVVKKPGEALACTLAGGATVSCAAADPSAFSDGEAAHVSIRPEHVNLVTDDLHGAQLTGHVEQKIFLGTDIQFVIRFSDHLGLTARVQSREGGLTDMQRGEQVGVSFDTAVTRLLKE